MKIIRTTFVILKNSRGEVFLLKRDKKRDIGKWEFPGGKIDADEDGQDALVREVKEECGATIRDATWLDCIVKGPSDETGGDIWVNNFFLCEKWSGKPRVMEDLHSECKWVKLCFIDPNDLVNSAPYPKLLNRIYR